MIARLATTHTLSPLRPTPPNKRDSLSVSIQKYFDTKLLVPSQVVPEGRGEEVPRRQRERRKMEHSNPRATKWHVVQSLCGGGSLTFGSESQVFFSRLCEDATCPEVMCREEEAQ